MQEESSLIFSAEEIAILNPKAAQRMQNIEVEGRENKTSRRMGRHHKYNTYFNKGPRAVSKELRFEVLDILAKILPQETALRPINEKIGFYGQDTAQRILATGRMNVRSARAIIDYYNSLNYPQV